MTCTCRRTASQAPSCGALRRCPLAVPSCGALLRRPLAVPSCGALLRRPLAVPSCVCSSHVPAPPRVARHVLIRTLAWPRVPCCSVLFRAVPCCSVPPAHRPDDLRARRRLRLGGQRHHALPVPQAPGRGPLLPHVPAAAAAAPGRPRDGLAQQVPLFTTRISLHLPALTVRPAPPRAQQTALW
jgi:hypothetical protein